MVFSDEPMEDLTALAVRLSQSVGDARGVLILSRDGLVLGACPADAEERLKVPWLRFASLGEPERGFLQFGGEIWSYVRRGAYAGFVVTGIGVRPGFVLDQIEIALLHAEEARARREGLRPETTPPQPVAPIGKPRTPLHPEVRPEPPLVIRAEAPSVGAASPAQAAPPGQPSVPAVGQGPPAPQPPAPSATGQPPGAAARVEVAAVGDAVATTAAEEAVDAGAPSLEAASPPPASAGVPATDGPAAAAEEEEEGEEEIDRFSLAREFSQLLQERDEGADG